MGAFRIEEIRDKDNETGLKEGGGIEMSNYSAFHIRDARSLFAFCILLTFHFDGAALQQPSHFDVFFFGSSMRLF